MKEKKESNDAIELLKARRSFLVDKIVESNEAGESGNVHRLELLAIDWQILKLESSRADGQS